MSVGEPRDGAKAQEIGSPANRYRRHLSPHRPMTDRQRRYISVLREELHVSAQHFPNNSLDASIEISQLEAARVAVSKPKRVVRPGKDRGLAVYETYHPRMHMGHRLRELGFASYKEYLASALWASAGERYRSSSEHLQECYVCAKQRFQLHHRTYKRLGAEALRDLIPLCGGCHRELHSQLHEHGGRLFTAAKVLRLQRQGDAPPIRRPTVATRKKPARSSGGQRKPAKQR